MYDRCESNESARRRRVHEASQIGLVVVLASASTPLVARPQTNDAKRPATGNDRKSPPHRQAGNYPTMLNMTYPEFAAATAKREIALLPIGSIEEHGPNLPLATDSILAVAQTRSSEAVISAGVEKMPLTSDSIRSLFPSDPSLARSESPASGIAIPATMLHVKRDDADYRHIEQSYDPRLGRL
jgi:hypothetical protein